MMRIMKSMSFRQGPKIKEEDLTIDRTEHNVWKRSCDKDDLVDGVTIHMCISKLSINFDMLRQIIFDCTCNIA